MTVCRKNIIRNFANNMKRILILCTGNSCRSKMAQAYLQHLDAGLYVRSAGTRPAHNTHPLAIAVMEEAGSLFAICSRTMSKSLRMRIGTL